ncbi:nose resistant to fluoxetine protein 6-like [Mizuhopecten yessoensis]|uniref:Nose resistant to fluoxetine protein 6 n=1 Tax=Mizuhopecten yessoensis TaxID=6573 RepID=A0A210PKZ3_MIZYE|nr:nose resistant to fluoxetine protein 6-like [Mizuhopecten yessoensis]OWF37158.1 Nose resistant to fluoxetine protein 6 [Mizuhopecten yessoensis]
MPTLTHPHIKSIMDFYKRILVLTVYSAFVVNSITAADEMSNYNKMFANIFEVAQRMHSTEEDKVAKAELFRSGSRDIFHPYVQKFKSILDSEAVNNPDVSEAVNMYNLSEAATTYNVSDACLTDTKQIILAFERNEQWVIKLLDALGKPSSGVLQGNIQWAGSYEECNAVEGRVFVNMVNNTGPQYTLKGKYCKGQLDLGIMGLSATLGTCVPKTCSTEDANTLMNLAISLLSNKMHFHGTSCPEVETEYDARAIVTLTICSIIGLMMLLGTGYDVIVVRYLREKERKQEEEDKDMTKNMDAGQYQSESSLNESTTLLKKLPKPTVVRSEEGVIGKILMAFSVMTNGEKLLSTAQGEGSLTAINGMRFLSITWVILGHNFSSGTSFSVNMLPFYGKMINRWTFQTIGNAFVSVDSFFTMSGLLLSYLFMKEMKKTNGKMNWAMFYFHRFWRLTPPYMLVLMISATLTRYMGGDGGPQWVKKGIEVDYCEDTWWTNLLYINNLVKTNKMCLGWSWYLANDMQFFVISPLMLVPLYYKKYLGFLVCGVLLVASFITTGVLNSNHGWPASPLDQRVGQSAIESYMDDYYFKPWCRIGPYIVGILAGYALQACDCRMKINKFVNLLGWLVATFTACAIVYGLYDSLTGTMLTESVAAFYNTVHRSAWGVCICWVIFACATGNGGFVNTLLSWKGLVPLSRLSYCAYLIHLIIITVRANSMQIPVYVSVFEEVVSYLGILMMTFGLAFITSLAFESPMMGLEKVLFPKKRK